MERVFFRERQEPKEENEKRYFRIGVTGLGQGVGTTFVATALAFYFRNQGRGVSFTECLQPENCNTLFFDQVAMDKRFRHRKFHNLYQKLADDAPLPEQRNKEAGIIWRLATPDDCNNKVRLTERQQFRLVDTAREEVCIFDMEADYSWDDYLMDMDLIFVVADPLPSKLIRSRKRFQTLKRMELSGCTVIWIVNMSNPGVDKKQVKNYLKADHLFWLEAMKTEAIYEDEYLCRFHWENKEFQRKMEEIFTKVSRISNTLWWFSI